MVAECRIDLRSRRVEEPTLQDVADDANDLGGGVRREDTGLSTAEDWTAVIEIGGDESFVDENRQPRVRDIIR